MAFKRFKKFSKKRWGKKRAFKKVRKTFSKKARSQKSNIATSTETLDLGTIPLTTDTAATAANFSSVTLKSFFRTYAVAANYRFYRITKVTYEYYPEANTYQAGLPTSEMVPRFISVMCRDGSFNGAGATAAGTINDLQEMGGKFRQFTKPIKISYAPNICLVTAALDVDGNVNTAANYVTRKKSPWLSTVPLNTGSTPPGDSTQWNHYGHQWAIVSDSFASGQIAARTKVTAHFEFKLPLAGS